MLFSFNYSSHIFTIIQFYNLSSTLLLLIVLFLYFSQVIPYKSTLLSISTHTFIRIHFIIFRQLYYYLLCCIVFSYPSHIFILIHSIIFHQLYYYFHKFSSINSNVQNTYPKLFNVVHLWEKNKLLFLFVVVYLQLNIYTLNAPMDVICGEKNKLLLSLSQSNIIILRQHYQSRRIILY